MADPDYLYDPDDWEFTHEWRDRADVADDAELSPGEIKRYATLVRGPDRFLARVVVSRDDVGDPDECQYRWFDTEAEAEAASVPASVDG